MLKKIRQDRVKKLNKLDKPYPKKVDKNAFVGRVRSIRTHGKSIFAHIQRSNEHNQQQIYLKEDILKKRFQDWLDLVDIGDFVQVKGEIFKTKTGEKTVKVQQWKMLTKSLRPLPEKWSGLQDKEQRFRKRYLDLLMNDKAKEIFNKRSEIIKTIRDFLGKNGFQEVETPILQNLYGGTNALPFKTHLNALDIDLYLRIAPELYLKRLLVGGMEKIFEIGRCFRNEGMDREHSPEFTMLEWYSAYWDWQDLMNFTEKLMHTIDPKIFPLGWDRVEYSDIVKDGDEKKAYAKLKKPTFVLHLPDIPLCKQGEALQGVVQGAELIKAFTEQNNPLEQRKAFESQEELRKQCNKEAQRLDEDFLKALEYGMPPSAGFGMGIDRLVKLITGAKTLREVILFPAMKPKKKK